MPIANLTTSKYVTGCLAGWVGWLVGGLPIEAETLLEGNKPWFRDAVLLLNSAELV